MPSMLFSSGATVGTENYTMKSNLYITYVSSPISSASSIELSDTPGERTESQTQESATTSSIDVDNIDVSVTIDGDDEEELLSVE
jgi:hypothetical protein